MPTVKALSETFFSTFEALKAELEALLPADRYADIRIPLEHGNVFRATGKLDRMYRNAADTKTLGRLAHEWRVAQEVIRNDTTLFGEELTKMLAIARKKFDDDLHQQLDFISSLSSIRSRWHRLMKNGGGAKNVGDLLRQTALKDHTTE